MVCFWHPKKMKESTGDMQLENGLCSATFYDFVMRQKCYFKILFKVFKPHSNRYTLTVIKKINIFVLICECSSK